MSKSGNIYKICPAMTEAGVEDPESEDGIRFCTDKCPYPFCVVFESSSVKEAATRRADFAKRLHRHGVSIKDIALILNQKRTTIQGYLKR